MAKLPKFSRPLGNQVEEHDGDVRFFTGSGNTAVSHMRNAFGHNYWNSSFIMDVAVGQIPRFICINLNMYIYIHKMKVSNYTNRNQVTCWCYYSCFFSKSIINEF